MVVATRDFSYVPVNEAYLVHGFNREDTLRDVETGDVLREGVVLDEHRHQISSWQELHDEVEVRRILEGVVELHDPWRVGLRENITFGAYVHELEKVR